MDGVLSALGLRTAKVMRSVRDYMVVVENADKMRSLSPNVAALGRLEMGIGRAILTAPGDGIADYV